MALCKKKKAIKKSLLLKSQKALKKKGVMTPKQPDNNSF